MSDQSVLKTVANIEDFFRDLILRSAEKSRLKMATETEAYLTHLLRQFMSTDSLYARDENGKIKEEPLALMLHDALHAANPQEQRSLFRYVGDVSLYTAGYFYESLMSRKVDVSYYIDLGGAAYNNVASLTSSGVARIYRELSQKFSSFVDVLAEVSEQTSNRQEKDLIRLYDLYTQTKSERVAKALREAGINPATLEDTHKKTQ